MKKSDIPSKIVLPFAAGAGVGFTRPIPVSSQIGIQDGAASFTDGFPPDCFQPVGAGGIPPFGKDFNGLLNQDTAWARWVAAGGAVPFDPAFATAIGGYPQGCIIESAVAIGKFWISTVDDNTTDPDSVNAQNWLGFSMVTAGLQTVVTYDTPGTYSYTPSAGTRAVLVEVQGGGGGGGGTNAPGAPGISVGISGGGGAYARKYLLYSGWTNATIVVGAGGAGGSPVGNGFNGGESSFTCAITTIICTGGAHGNNNGTQTSFPAGTATAGGGTATGGDINIPGGTSQSALMLSATQALVGLAGYSQFGTSNIQFGIHAAGSNGLGKGSGGTGGLAYGGDTAVPGGDGADGLVLVTELK